MVQRLSQNQNQNQNQLLRQLQPQPQSQSQSQPSQSASVLDSQNPTKMKSLFKPKPRTPVDVVRQTRDLLMYTDRSPETKESKREEKVRSPPVFFFLLPSWGFYFRFPSSCLNVSIILFCLSRNWDRIEFL